MNKVLVEDTELVSETSEPPLTLKQLHATLANRGVKVSYSGLSELIAEGDIAQQLGVGGQGNRREFAPGTADTLAPFLTLFQKSGAKRSHAPYLLSRFLEAGGLVLEFSSVSETTELARPVVSEMAELTSLVSETTELARTGDIQALIFLYEAQGRAQGLALAEQVLTAKEAAAVLKVSPRALRKSVPPYRRFGGSALGDRWLLSDLMKRA